MPEFHNPYHFVPATGRVQRDGDQTPVETVPFDDLAAGASSHPARHDRWVSGTHSGRLICRLTLERPTIVGSEQLLPDDGNPDGPKQVEPYQCVWRDADGADHRGAGFPGSSLRGMIGAVAETISQSTLRVLEDRPYTVRVDVREHEKALSALGRLVSREKPAADGSEFDLVPVALPTLPQAPNGTFGLTGGEARWRGIFGSFRWDQVLTTYVDGYEEYRAADGSTRVRIKANSFLDNEARISFDPVRPHYYYAHLAPSPLFAHRVQDGIDGELRHGLDSQRPALKVKEAGRMRFLLGRHADTILTEEEWSRQPSVHKNLYTRGYLRVLGIDGRAADMPPTKKHELFIPDPEDKPRRRIPVPRHVLETFDAIAAERARDSDGQHPFALRGIDHWQCRDGDLVHFDIDNDGRITEIAISAIWRRKLGAKGTSGMQSSYDFFDAQSPGHLLTPLRPEPKDQDQRTELTPAELLLGVVDEGKDVDERSARALASRLRCFDAASLMPPRLAHHPITLKTLSSPKPPSPALYFHPEGAPGQYIAKGSLNSDAEHRHRPNGRKFYLHHPKDGLTGKPANWDCVSHARDQRDHLRLSCSPLLPDEGNPFWFHLDFDNLSDAELTLLITALRPSDAFRHKLGLGKSLGLGTVRLDIAGLFLVDRQQRYGPDALEQPRYTNGWLPGSGDGKPAWAIRYPSEAHAAQASAQDWPRSTDAQSLPWWNSRLIDESALAILTTIGDPNKLQTGAPVCTPLTEQQRQAGGQDPGATETETFKWFEANTGAQQGLPPVEPGQPLPTLPYLRGHGH